MLYDPNLTLYYCDRVAMLKKGRVVAEGPTGHVMNNRIMREVLGENIQTDITREGRLVVTPREPVEHSVSLISDTSEEMDRCDVRTVNGNVN